VYPRRVRPLPLSPEGLSGHAVTAVSTQTVQTSRTFRDDGLKELRPYIDEFDQLALCIVYSIDRLFLRQRASTFIRIGCDVK